MARRRQSVLTLSVPTPVNVAVGVLTDTAARYSDARLELRDGALVVTIPNGAQQTFAPVPRGEADG